MDKDLRERILRDTPQDPRFNETTTKREMFAGLALQGLLSNRSVSLRSTDETVKLAVRCADALLVELEKQP